MVEGGGEFVEFSQHAIGNRGKNKVAKLVPRRRKCDVFTAAMRMMICTHFGGAVVEPGVKLVDDSPVLLDGVEPDLVRIPAENDQGRDLDRHENEGSEGRHLGRHLETMMLLATENLSRLQRPGWVC